MMATMAIGSDDVAERSGPAIASLAKGEIAGLDGLRALSVLSVMFSHFGFGNVLPGGLGVTVFFFISGFLITTLMLREAKSTGAISIGRFYLRRLLRLQPELWAMIAITTVTGVAYSVWVWPRTIDILGAIFYFSNYLYVGVLTPGVAGDLRWPHLWSLAIEEHYYLTYPLMFLALHRTPRRLMAVLAAVLVVELVYRLVLNHAGVDSHYLYAATDARLDSIGYGCLTALVLWYLPAPLVAFCERNGLGFAVAAVLIMLGSLIYRDPDFRDTWRYSLQGLSLGVGFVALYAWSGGKAITNLLDLKPMRWMGRMSYGAYLWHLEVGAGLAKLIGVPLEAPPSLKVALIAILFTVATFAVAAVSFEFLQKPLAGLRHRLGSVVPAKAAA